MFLGVYFRALSKSATNPSTLSPPATNGTSCMEGLKEGCSLAASMLAKVRTPPCNPRTNHPIARWVGRSVRKTIDSPSVCAQDRGANQQSLKDPSATISHRYPVPTPFLKPLLEGFCLNGLWGVLESRRKIRRRMVLLVRKDVPL